MMKYVLFAQPIVRIFLILPLGSKFLVFLMSDLCTSNRVITVLNCVFTEREGSQLACTYL
jgi:hypothetical protein